MPLSPLVLLFGATCAFVMGNAIQRGSTCLVAAIDELLIARRITRLLAIVEASLWVTGGLLVARAVGDTVAVPQPFTTTGWAIAGGCLFGIGACINGACAFGTIARLGSGELAYVFMPLGLFAGDLSLGHVLQMMATSAPDDSLMLAIGSWLLVPVIVLIAWRVLGLGRSLVSLGSVSRPWSAHGATTVIGVTFLVMFLTVGPWAYTDILSDIAHGAGGVDDFRWILIVALLLGAISAGWRTGRFQFAVPAARAAVRCFAGGLLMGWGSALIPGGNDGLLLIGMPLLRSYAWSAALAMTATILVTLSIARLPRAASERI
ncbi:MAG: hypothetical protein BVN33_17010 [Proteobacteria bacterium ST_bin13]|nr:MAG: hypothetical protein BVN33_17010 [Proteobacteria bacterium ST_bin13]